MRWRGKLLGVGFAIVAQAASAQEFVNIAYVPPTLTVRGAERGDGIGSLNRCGAAVGDLSGDGIPDLVIGSPGSDGPANLRNDTGEVDVFFGPITGPRIQDLASEAPDLVIYGREASGFLGSSWLVADMDGDGQDDLVVGQDASRRPDTNDSIRGEVCVFFGPLAAGDPSGHFLAGIPARVLFDRRRMERDATTIRQGQVVGNRAKRLAAFLTAAAVLTRILQDSDITEEPGAANTAAIHAQGSDLHRDKPDEYRRSITNALIPKAWGYGALTSIALAMGTDSAEFERRSQALVRASAWIAASGISGRPAFTSKSFCNDGFMEGNRCERDAPRIDIEILKGVAFNGP